MRLTCPNCGAQYEVPDEVIPADGRDVQCSSCGETWFQAHPDQAEQTPSAPDVQPHGVGTVPEESQSDETPETEPAGHISEPEPEPEPDPEPEPQDHADAPADDMAVDDDPDNAPIEQPVQSEIDPAVANILREEAERETRLREAEGGDGLESQPELGLDGQPDDEAARRSREAQDRMARMRGEDQAEHDDMLPDVDEINSTLRGSGEAASQTAVAVGEVHPQKRGGFLRGFAVVFIIAAVLVLIYGNADSIGNAVPATEPVLNAYVALVDQGRLWLEGRFGQFMPK